jgi:hypothetical protein
MCKTVGTPFVRTCQEHAGLQSDLPYGQAWGKACTLCSFESISTNDKFSGCTPARTMLAYNTVIATRSIIIGTYL